MTDKKTDAATLQAALAMAALDDTHLDVICLGVDLSVASELPSASVMVVSVPVGDSDAYEDAHMLAEWVSTQLPAYLDKITIREVVANSATLAQVISQAVRYCELVLVTQPYGDGRDGTNVSVTEAALFYCKVPIFVVPMTAASRSGRILIAWDESEGAISAIRQSLPMLRTADHVDVVMVAPPSHSPERSDPGGALCMMLSRHGIKAEVSILAKSMPRIADVLMRYAQDRGSDLIVMGGYGHSRLREAVFGGVTRDMLESSTVPLLMAH